MRSWFSIFGLVVAASVALGAGCATDDGLLGIGGSGSGGKKPGSEASPQPSPTPSGTGGSIVND